MILRLLLLTMTIPLSAMAGEFSRLTPVQEYFILAGHHCCYSDEVVEQVLKNNQRFPVQENEFNVVADIPQHALEEQADKWMWALFWGIQIADIYSTQEGVKYDCIQEANPLLPNIPTIAEMATLKAVVLFPTYGSIGYENITRADLIAPLVLGAGVVANNMRLVNKAENQCDLR